MLGLTTVLAAYVQPLKSELPDITLLYMLAILLQSLQWYVL